MPPKSTPSPYNHLPDSLALTLKVLKRYKREGRALSADDAAVIAAIADEITGFGLEKVEEEKAVTSPTTTSGNSTVGSRLNEALNKAAELSNGATPVKSIQPTSDKAPLSPDSQQLETSNRNIVSPPLSPGRVKGLISKLRKAADSGEVFRELLDKSATVDSLVDFAVQCNKASNNRVELAEVIVNGFRALTGYSGPTPPGSAHHASEAPFYGDRNMRVFLLNKNNEVLEDPLTGEMIGGITEKTCGQQGFGDDAHPSSARSEHHSTANMVSVGVLVSNPNATTSQSSASAITNSAREHNFSSGGLVSKSNSLTTTDTSAKVALIVRAITDAFYGGNNGEWIERSGHLYLPLSVDGECLGVLAIFEYKTVVDSEHKANILAACQSIASLSVRNVGLIEDVGYQMSKANAMLQMANQLASDNLDERTLSQSIIVTAKQLIDSDRCSIFVVKGDTLQAYFEDGQTVIISNQSGIAGHVARTGETVNIVEAYDDNRFNSDVDKATGYRTKSILCMPIRFGDHIVGVAQLINKRPLMVNGGQEVSGKPSIAQWEVERPFSSRDEELFSTFSTFVGVSLRNCRINQGLQIETEKSKAILEVVAMLSQTDIRDVKNIATHVMAGAKKLLHADRSTLFLVDKENNELYSELADNNSTGADLRVPIGKGVAGKVAETQQAENIVDAYQHPDFDPSVDKALGYSTYSMLCEPITFHNEVLAVAQLMNKVDGNGPEGSFTAFTAKDQETFRTFAMFAGISISNAHMLQFAVEAGNELIQLNNRIDEGGLVGDQSMRVDPLRRRNSEISKARIGSKERASILEALAILNSTPDIDVTSPSFDLFAVRRMSENPSDMGCAVVLKVFQQTGFLELFQVDTETFINFICFCRRMYRKVPYHNFFHVVDACQTIYTFLFRGGIREYLSDLDCFTLLITALVHDLDHMGVNNSFHLKTDSPLGILSSATGNTSVLEVHHCNLAVDILTDPTANVFSGLDDQSRSTAVKTMIECVLATDMARHGEFLSKFETVVANGNGELINMSDPLNRKLVMDLVMKAADISNVTKPFELSRLWAVAVTEEFYRQGDQERAKGVEVLPQFDRSKKTELAKGQIGFINFVCEKFFTVISGDGAFPGMRWTLENLQRNKQEWTEILNGTTRRASLLDLTASPRNSNNSSTHAAPHLDVKSK